MRLIDFSESINMIPRYREHPSFVIKLFEVNYMVQRTLILILHCTVHIGTYLLHTHIGMYCVQANRYYNYYLLILRKVTTHILFIVVFFLYFSTWTAWMLVHFNSFTGV